MAYTSVVLPSRHAGVADTPTNELSECTVLADAGKIAGRSAATVMNKVESPNLVESAIGVATINALSQAAFEGQTREVCFL